MHKPDPALTLGIEEEYLLVDQETLDLAAAPDALMRDCVKELEKKVSPEFLQCQIEVGTGVCETIGEAREDLGHLRKTIKRVANQYGLAPLAVSTHPFADWQYQHHTDKDRYNALQRDLGGVVRRLLICGMHVHVGLSDDDRERMSNHVVHVTRDADTLLVGDGLRLGPLLGDPILLRP